MTWYENDASFDREDFLLLPFVEEEGPHGVALVDVYASGRTTPGWGLQGANGKPGFMVNYAAKKFWPRPRLIDLQRHHRAYAIVMRSVNIIALDIDRHTDDGGADGFKAAAKLDLPVTLAQTSKSGAGRHLFYRTDEIWDDELGFGHWDDVIGLKPGIDVRAVGCIYHYASQRWNREPLADLPDELHDLLEARKAKKEEVERILRSATSDDITDEERLIMHDTLIQELNKPIDTGKRNVTLFAIGTKMKTAGVPDWEARLHQRALDVGLPDAEAAKLVSNVQKYGV